MELPCFIWDMIIWLQGRKRHYAVTEDGHAVSGAIAPSAVGNEDDVERRLPRNESTEPPFST